MTKMQTGKKDLKQYLGHTGMGIVKEMQDTNHKRVMLSSYEPVNPYTTLSEEAGKLLVDEIACLARRGFRIPKGALFYCPETQDVKLFDYFSVEYLGIPEEDKIKNYLDSYRALYT